MRIRSLLGALALTVASGLALPAVAEAGHRHSRHCRHSHGEYRSSWGPRHGGYSYRTYRYVPYYDSYYDPYYDPYYTPYRYRHRHRARLHYHGSARCYAPHVSLHIGW